MTRTTRYISLAGCAIAAVGFAMSREWMTLTWVFIAATWIFMHGREAK